MLEEAIRAAVQRVFSSSNTFTDQAEAALDLGLGFRRSGGSGGCGGMTWLGGWSLLFRRSGFCISEELDLQIDAIEGALFRYPFNYISPNTAQP